VLDSGIAACHRRRRGRDSTVRTAVAGPQRLDVDFSQRQAAINETAGPKWTTLISELRSG
jgi:recombinational DNA repair ATPase RecF